MSYTDLIKNSKEKVYNHSIATKILDLMDKLRMDNNGKSKRRWIWELIQNAKDVRDEDIPLNIEICLNEELFDEHLEFKHNGKPFSVDNITFLIEQVSTKERSTKDDAKPKTTGKFGTGFLTTHLLSEIVTISGYIKEPKLPYKNFKLSLDRSGSTIDEVILSVQKSLDVLSKIEKADEASQYDENNLNTAFEYRLDEESVLIAKEGLEDLIGTLPYAMIFVPEIKSVTLTHNGTTFTTSDEIIEEGDEIRIHTIKKEAEFEEESITIAELSVRKTTITIPIILGDNGSVTIKPLSLSIPRLFCDFPLVGSEEFHIPMIVNSSYFNPNEPRSGIFLTDRPHEKITENKDLITDAIELYKILLEYASENCWNGMHHLASISGAPEVDWLSSKWYNDNILDAIHSVLSVTPIVDTEHDGRKEILTTEGKSKIWFPYSGRKEVRDKLWKLCYQWIPSIIPDSKEIHNWYPLLWKDCGKLSIQVVGNSIAAFKNMSKLEANLAGTATAEEWLNQFFDLVNFEGKFINEIISDKCILMPNQLGDFKKKSDLYWDDHIDEELKDILLMLGEDIREKLRNINIVSSNEYDSSAANQISHHTKKPDDVIGRINKLIVKTEKDIALKASLQMVALFPPHNQESERRSKLFNFCTRIFRLIQLEKKTISYGDHSIWIESDKIIVASIIASISRCRNLLTFVTTYNFNDKGIALKWIDSFISFLLDDSNEANLNDIETPILPNQNGIFVTKDLLFLDDGTVDEKLKDIAEKLGFPVRTDLLDKEIFMDLPDNRTMTQRTLAEKITTLILPKLSELKRSEETKDIFRMLYLWFRDNKGTAQSIFAELYSARHKLYDDDEVASNMQQAEAFKSLMEEFSISDISELRQIISARGGSTSTEENAQDAEAITKESLVSLGIGSMEELEIALKDANLAQIFIHNSIPTIDMFIYAQKLIERAKQNILAYLEQSTDYDCKGVEEIAPTILAGIKRKGVETNIVTRPSDNGEVIIYYSSEKDILELRESELWIDNGIDDPSILTFGRFLKVTGISKIKI